MTSTISFGKALKRAAVVASPDSTPEVALKVAKRGTPHILDLDFSLIKVGVVEKGGQGDKFVKVTYDGRRLEFALNKLPDWAHAAFDAGTFKNEDGKEIGDKPSWTWVVEVDDRVQAKLIALQDYIIDLVAPMRNDLLPQEAKKNIKKGGMSIEQFAEKFNSKITAANPEKQYSATVRFFVESDTTKQMPKIQKMHKKGEKFTRPKEGTLDDLKKGSACVVVLSLVRGFYAGQTGVGCGMKFAATSIDILDNMKKDGAPRMDYSGIEFLDEDTPDSVEGAEDTNDADGAVVDEVVGVSTESTDTNKVVDDGSQAQFDNDNPKPAGF